MELMSAGRVCFADPLEQATINLTKFYQHIFRSRDAFVVELVSKELNHLAAILHVYAGGLNFMK